MALTTQNAGALVVGALVCNSQDFNKENMMAKKTKVKVLRPIFVDGSLADIGDKISLDEADAVALVRMGKVTTDLSVRITRPNRDAEPQGPDITGA